MKQRVSNIMTLVTVRDSPLPALVPLMYSAASAENLSYNSSQATRERGLGKKIVDTTQSPFVFVTTRFAFPFSIINHFWC